MEGKLTLITPPDVFENESYSIMFIHLNDEDQEKVSQWFANSNIKENVNIYFYSGESDLSWFFHAMARSEYKYIDLDGLNNVTSILSGYILGKKNTYYKISDENTSAICHYINQNRIVDIEKFLQRTFNDQNQ
jgi:hypothetical protein